jgi:hypothetical protein
VWSFFVHSEPGQGVGRDLARKRETVAHISALQGLGSYCRFSTIRNPGKGSDGIWFGMGRQWLTFKHCKAWVERSFFDHSEPGQGIGRDLAREGETVAHI